MKKESITLIRDDGAASTAAAGMLRSVRLPYLELFPDDQSIKPFIAVTGFPEGFEGIEGIKYFVHSGIWKRLDLPSRAAAPDETLVRVTLSKIARAESSFDPVARPPDVRSLAEIFSAFEELLQKMRFDEVDEVLKRTNPAGRHSCVLLSILTATLPAKKSLRERAALYDRIKNELLRNGEDDPRLLSGLD